MGDSWQISHVAAAGLNKKGKGRFTASFFLQLHLSMVTCSLLFCSAKKVFQARGRWAGERNIQPPGIRAGLAANWQLPVTSLVLHQRSGNCNETQNRSRHVMVGNLHPSGEGIWGKTRQWGIDTSTAAKHSRNMGGDCYDRRTSPMANINIKTGDTDRNVQVYIKQLYQVYIKLEGFQSDWQDFAEKN